MRLAEFKIEKPKPEDTMGITRDKMPQVKSTDYDEYKSYLKKNGVTLTSQVVSAKDLKPIQKEFSDQGVERQLTKNKKYDGQNPKPLLASSDSWIIDGHHRWLAALNTGRDINILRANVDVHELLSLTLKFPSVYFKDIYTEDESMDIIAKAEQFAQEAHKDHKRKYTGEPYYVHLDEVRNIVKQAGGSVNQQCAALLHDTVEDTSVTPADVTREFGPQIAKLVVELTDVSKPEDGNRKVRKGIDRDKLAGVSAEAQTVKYADLISNGRDIGKNDPKFAKVYHAEKADLLRVMKNGKASLRKEAINMLPDELKAIANSGENERVNEALNVMLSALREEALNVKPIITQAIRKLDKVFKKNGYQVRIVGGAVRDIALGKDPKDIDFASDATPDEMIAMLDKAGIRHIPTGIEHGTITAVIDNEDFEITTLRSDTNTDGRHADVEFVRSWEEDAKRRDLTYNAMSMDIDGTVHDYNGGMDDLQDKVSRFVGDPEERIKEDYLRILRYFRFQSKLDSPKWDDTTLNAIKDNADGMTGLSVERIWQEMGKLLMGSSAKEALEWMNKTGVSSMIGLEGINPAKLGEPTGPIIALARMLDNSSIARDWKMSNYDREMFDFLIKHKGENINSKQAQDMIIKGASQDHLLAWANMHGKNDVYDAVQGFEQPDFPINGKDLLARGHVAGPNLGKMIADLKDEWMKSNYKLSKEDLLNKVPVKESIVLEAVGKFMTGHNVKFAGKKYEQIEVEVTGVDNDKRLYHISILHPKELFGKQVSISAKFMHRGPWVKTDTKKVANWAESKYDSWMNKKSLDEDFERLLEDNTPDVYVDMDGVLVDFFNEWARIMNVKSYRDIPKEQIGKALKKIVNTPNFWEDLPTLAGHKELLNTIKATKGKYKILSSPLANDPNVDPGKREWVRKHLNFFKPEQVIIDHNKSKYATKQDGTPNLLIDDFGKNVKGWQSAGGIAIKHHTTTTANTIQAIKKVFSRKDVKEAAGVGRVVPGINTTVDVGPNEITKQAKKFGNDVDKDGKPKKLLRTKKK